MFAAKGRPAPSPFEAVYAEQYAAIRRLAYLLVRSEAIADELSQEAFLRLYAQFDDVENPPGFLRTVVVRLALTWQSRHRMEQQRLAILRPAESGALAEIDETWAAIGRLQPARATVLVLRFYEDMTNRDIERLLGCSAATVRSRVHRALADLRKELT